MEHNGPNKSSKFLNNIRPRRHKQTFNGMSVCPWTHTRSTVAAAWCLPQRHSTQSFKNAFSRKMKERIHRGKEHDADRTEYGTQYDFSTWKNKQTEVWWWAGATGVESELSHTGHPVTNLKVQFLNPYAITLTAYFCQKGEHVSDHNTSNTAGKNFVIRHP